MRHQKFSIQCEGSMDYASLYTYIIDESPEFLNNKRPLILICPGGGYGFTSDREAEVIAIEFMHMGYHAAVLRYSVCPATYPTANLELGKAISIIREHAEEWNVIPDKIVLNGYSAGGHMVASYACFWKKPFMAEKLGVAPEVLKPNGLILGYPVITSGEFSHHDSIKNLLGDRYEAEKDNFSLENFVTDAVPRTFIWSTFQDGLVPMENSMMFASALREKGIPVELHIFEKGDHGLGLADERSTHCSGGSLEPTCVIWMELCRAWLKNL